MSVVFPKVGVEYAVSIEGSGEPEIEFRSMLVEIVYHCGQCGHEWADKHACSGFWAGVASSDLRRCDDAYARLRFANGVTLGPLCAVLGDMKAVAP